MNISKIYVLGTPFFFLAPKLFDLLTVYFYFIFFNKLYEQSSYKVCFNLIQIGGEKQGFSLFFLVSSYI